MLHRLIIPNMSSQINDTIAPGLSAPPKRIKIESDTPVESRMKTVLTFTFSPKTNHGYCIV